MANSLRTTVATPRKWPGRLAPSRMSERPGTSTKVAGALPGYIVCGVGREDDVGAGPGADFVVGFGGPGIAGEILVRAELGRVDEDRDDDEPGLGAAAFDEPGVAGVQGAHRRDQADDFPRRAGRPDCGTDLVDGLDHRDHGVELASRQRRADAGTRDCSGKSRRSAGRRGSRPRPGSWRRSGERPRPSHGRTRSPGDR